jgi:hypothetical protein
MVGPENPGPSPRSDLLVLASDDKDALASVTVGVRVLQDVEQVATLDVKDGVLEPDASVPPELRVLRVV